MTTTRLDKAQTLPLCRCGRGTHLKYVRFGFNGFKSRESPLLSKQTHTPLLFNFSAQGTAVVSVKNHTYIGHRTTLGLSCCRQCSRGTPSSGGTSSASNNARQQQRQRRQGHRRVDTAPGSSRSEYTVPRTQTTIPHHFGLMLLFSRSFFSCRQAQGRATA